MVVRSSTTKAPQIRRRLGVLGVLGGMGPMATVDFLDKVVAATPAHCDQQHIPMFVRFCPEVPDRVDALLRGGPSPASELIAAAQSLELAGAECIAVPCNTAHYWHAAIQENVGIPVMHIADAVLDVIRESGMHGPLGIVATAGTLFAGIYHQRDPRIVWIEPTAEELEHWVMPGIHHVKAGETAKATPLIEASIAALVERGATLVLLGCTEIPVALRDRTRALSAGSVPLLDATDTLARACVRWATESLEQQPSSTPLA
jgi:aspartate racemase